MMDESGELVSRSTLKEAIKKIQDNVATSIAASTNATGDLIDSRTNKLATDIEQVESAIVKAKYRADTNAEAIANQSVVIEELAACDRRMHVSIERIDWAIEGIQKRLNGTENDQIKQESLESIRQVSTRVHELLNGGNGRLSYSAIQASIEQTKFLGQLLNWAIGIFGFGAVLAAGGALTGVGKAPDLAPTLTAAQTEIKLQAAAIKTLEGQLNRLEGRVLSKD
jgi:hypothetical protein